VSVLWSSDDAGMVQLILTSTYALSSHATCGVISFRTTRIYPA